MKQFLITICAIICLTVAILCAGVVVCISTPQITENLTRATALVDTAHFTRDQLVKTADSTRAFVAGEVDKMQLYQVIKEINQEQKTEFADIEPVDFAAVSEEYSLNVDSIKHLEDVQSLFANIKIAFGICAFGAILFCSLLIVFCGRGPFGRVLVWTGLMILFGLVALIIWSVMDFNGMFNTLHSLFFKEGSWFFGEKSLMISMYPSAFWGAMAGVSIAISAGLSVVSLIIGKIIK